jgi:hypothetical protein
VCGHRSGFVFRGDVTALAVVESGNSAEIVAFRR